MKWFTATLQRDFARHGFVTCPLTTDQITTLYKNNVKLEEAYGVGCDVHCGFSFNEALADASGTKGAKGNTTTLSSEN